MNAGGGKDDGSVPRSEKRSSTAESAPADPDDVVPPVVARDASAVRISYSYDVL